MFARLRRWLRGRKKNVTISKPTKQKSSTRDTLRKSQSLHDIVLSRENEDDGFRRNDLDDFDIVPAGEHNNNISASTISLVSPHANATPPADSVSQVSQDGSDEFQSELDVVEKTLHLEEFLSETVDTNINESLDGSIVDLVTPSPTEPEQIPAQDDLTLDEMQVMDMFDSMVLDIETEEKDAQSEIVSLKEDASNCIPDDNQSVQEEEIVSAQQKIASHTKSPVDFAQVFGEGSGETTDVGKVDNWRISRVESVRKSIKFVDSNIYLPPRPELPPTDYPDTDDELRQDVIGDEDVSNNVNAPHDSSLNSPAYSSSALPQSPSPRANGKVENQEMPNLLSDVSTLEITDKKIHSNTLPKTSLTNGNPQFSVPTTSLANGKNFSSSVSVVPKKPKPRVTSFKSSGKAPQIKNAQNFTELVEKFEKF